ncbi:MAG: cysteine desulfurase family protein [Bryobacteraceae bacterium]
MNRCYFDHNATTPLAPEVAQAMADVLCNGFGNPSSVHQEGQAARQLLEGARRRIGSIVGADQTEIVFTSGGTESNNLAILGITRGVLRSGKHVITSAIEHPAVLEPCRQLQREGFDVTFLPVDRNGGVSAEDVGRHLKPETVLVSIMHANNEVGTVQPIAEIAEIVRAARCPGRQIYLHSDGVQAPGRIPVDMGRLKVDLYSLSAHKVHGPKGSGALYVRKGVRLPGIQLGGRHERGRRAGTENVAAAVAFSKAMELSDSIYIRDQVKVLRDEFERNLLSRMDEVEINGAAAERLPNTSNLHFRGVDGQALVIALDLKGFAVSSGSACSSGSIEPSHVLLAMGRSASEARSSVRFSFGSGNTLAEVHALADAVISSVRHLRASHHVREDEYVPA